MDFNLISSRSIEYLDAVNTKPPDFEKLSLVFIEEMESCNVKMPEFEKTFQWLNIKESLSFNNNLKGKLCVMDFFTYCCINCLHILPDLHALEERFTVQEGLVVIGIHSAKFQNEKILSNILSAVIRYDISHPVVNDADATLWSQMSIQCWPTLVVVSPVGQVLLYLIGEGHRNFLFNFIELALNRYKTKGLLSKHDLPLQLEKKALKCKSLKYPGKLTISPCEKMLAVSDSGHHQIVILEKNGIVVKRIGSGNAGLKDGEANVSQFNSPQGLAWCENAIYVADTENHSIREINVKTWETKTVVGIGKQGVDKEGGKEGRDQEISSPWDVVVGPSPGFDATVFLNNCLYIAAAGTHQIWCYFLKDGTWLKKGHQKKGICLRFAGSGEEENRNNSYPVKASFAQPSGLSVAVVKDQLLLFVADSESSSIRSVEIKTGAVKACVGADRDPTNLFAYGDVDGKGFNAKLQHPLAVAAADGHLYIADSYNHKIKVVDLLDLSCTTLAGSGNSGLKNGDFLSAEFNEPCGILRLAETIYIADTNNHSIRVLDLLTNSVSTLEVREIDQSDSAPLNIPKQLANKSLVGSRVSVTTLDNLKCNLNNQASYSIRVILPEGFHYTNETESKWQLTVYSSSETELNFKTGVLDDGEIKVPLPSGFSSVLIKLELLLFFCSENGFCHMKQYIIHQTLLNELNADKSVMTTFSVPSKF